MRFLGSRLLTKLFITLFFLLLIPCYFGTVFSDLDITLLGIGGHRNPIFHSGIVFFLMLVQAGKTRSFPVAAAISGFGVGLGSHLVWDLFDHADVRWIPDRELGTYWLGMNGLLCLILSRTFLSSRIEKTGFLSNHQ